MEKLPTNKIEHTPENIEEKKKAAERFRYSALVGSALLASLPAAAEAWSEQDMPSVEEAQQLLLEHGLPSTEELGNAELTYYRAPAQGAPTLVHIRQVHRLKGVTADQETIENTAAVQGDIYHMIQTLSQTQPYAQYYPEGYSEKYLDTLLEPEKKLHQSLKLAVHEQLATYDGSTTFDLDTVVREVADTHKKQTGERLSRIAYGKLAAIGLSMLEAHNINVEPGTMSGIVDTNPTTYLNYYQGGFERAYEAGFVQNVRGCENHDLASSFGQDVEEVLAYNKEREQIVASCFGDEMEASNSDIAVTIYGGAHNFSQELDPRYGYLVLTPQAYRDMPDSHWSID